MYKKSELKNIVALILSQLAPRNVQVTRIEFEGPEIAIYIGNPEILVHHPDVAKDIAKKLKKRIVIRTDPSARKSKRETEEFIRKVVPPEAGIKGIEFDDVLGEVVVKAEKIGLVYGKGRSIYNRVLAETGWRLTAVRVPPVDPKELSTLNKILHYTLEQSSYRLGFLRAAGERIHRGVILENRYVRVTALGGFMEVGRSAILVETSESRVLLDVGINPGFMDFRMYPHLDVDQLRIDELDAVVVTHAHLDHVGMVPYLFKYGYRGPVYVTKPTRDLMVLQLLDLLDIMHRSNRKPPYSQLEVKKMLLHTITLDYGEVTDIAPDIKLTFYNAGHILGSAMAHLHIGEGLHNIVYTGDFKFGRTRLLDKAEYEFPRVETLIMESTYGDREQPRRDLAELELISAISRTVARGGKVLIPAMAIGRSQEILLVLSDALRRKLLPDVKVYIDGSIPEVTAIHLTYPELLSQRIGSRILQGDNPFYYEGMEKVKNKQMREDIAKSSEPAVIVATSGMLNGGPSVEYLRMLASDSRNSLIFVGYQAKGTLGRRILDGEREVTMIGEDGKLELIKINMEVKYVEGFSGHSDRRQLLAFVANMKPKPKNIILNHGEPQSIYSLAETLRRRAQHLGLPSDVRIYTPSVLSSLYLAGLA